MTFHNPIPFDNQDQEQIQPKEHTITLSPDDFLKYKSFILANKKEEEEQSSNAEQFEKEKQSSNAEQFDEKKHALTAKWLERESMDMVKREIGIEKFNSLCPSEEQIDCSEKERFM